MNIHILLLKQNAGDGLIVNGRVVCACFTDSKVKLRDLLPNTSYVFTVRAKNDVGSGDSLTVSVTTSPPR